MFSSRCRYNLDFRVQSDDDLRTFINEHAESTENVTIGRLTLLTNILMEVCEQGVIVDRLFVCFFCLSNFPAIAELNLQW